MWPWLRTEIVEDLAYQGNVQIFRRLVLDTSAAFIAWLDEAYPGGLLTCLFTRICSSHVLSSNTDPLYRLAKDATRWMRSPASTWSTCSRQRFSLILPVLSDSIARACRLHRDRCVSHFLVTYATTSKSFMPGLTSLIFTSNGCIHGTSLSAKGFLWVPWIGSPSRLDLESWHRFEARIRYPKSRLGINSSQQD